ncbi:polysaccharide biosynthesis tyrosine autokinase [Phenylobacterium sp. LjRoot219]|uniref:GumC family protein n=1 Tax=Phenylobacterium sp. LjRoot219 TaxID=3342283 RepID=UPI003ED14A97
MNAHTPSPVLDPKSHGRQGTPLSQWSSALSWHLDLRRLWNVFRRRLGLFAAVAAVVLLAAILVTVLATPKYTATANVMLDPRREKVTNSEAVLSGALSGLPTDTAVVDTEVEVLKSRQLAAQVVKALNLEADPEFSPRTAKPSGVKGLIASVTGMFGAPDQSRLGSLAQQTEHEAVVDNVLAGLSVKRAGLTYVINVSYESESPQKAAQIGNKFAELYLLGQMTAKVDATRQATTWLNERLEQMRGQVLADEAAVQQYKIANNLLSASGTNLTEAEISNYNQTLAQAQAQVAEDAARLSTARGQLARGSTGEDVGEALDSRVIQQLREQRTQVSSTVADLQGRYGERHPEMLKAKRQLSDIDAQIQAEIQRVISNLEAKVQVSRQRAGAVAGSLGGAKGMLAANNRAMVRLNELQRTADASRTLYESYLNRYKETSSQQGIEQSDARMVSAAKIPSQPSSPKVPVNLTLGLLLALGAGIGVIVLAEMLDSGLATADDVERRLDATYLGAIPLLASVAGKSKAAPIDYVVGKPLSSFSEAFRNLRTSILYSRLGEPVKIVAVTSSLPGEGKTTTSICLGRAAALQGQKVLVVDCDLRRRALNRLLRNEPAVGLLEVLNGEATLEQAIAADTETGAHFLPLSTIGVTPKDVFGTAAMDRLLGELRRRYDLVVLDTAPVLAVADTRVLAPKADVVIVLARWRKTPQHAVESAFRFLSGGGAHIGGVALTRVDMRQQAKYGYGDPGYYYAECKKYYVS